ALGAASLPQHWLGVLGGSPVQAAEPDVEQRLAELRADLRARTEKHDIGAGAAFMPADWRPVHCAVLATNGRGGGGEPDELLLDHSYADLAGCSPFLTKGDVLLGYLARPGEGVAVDDRPEDPARVVLLNHRRARPVHAETAVAGTRLAMVVGPAAAVDPAPLRTELWSHPFVAAQLRLGGQPVHIAPLELAIDQPPAGLWIGRSLIWGYEGSDGSPPITIGVYVDPPFAPRSLSHVVAWRAPDAMPATEVEAKPRHRRVPGVLRPLQGDERFLLTAEVEIPDGAAIEHAGVCLGTARRVAFGQALVTSAFRRGRTWNLILLPHVPTARPREVAAEVVDVVGGLVTLRCRADAYTAADDVLPEGYLFTGSNGRHCPPGLFLGLATPTSVHGELTVQRPLTVGAQSVYVVAGDSAP
ncbi:MAG: hypothetical protein RL398_307, partial [Planctomycetota bacterium]